MNWTPTGPPGTTGEARFNSPDSTYTVTFNTDPTNARMRVGNDHVTFDLDGHTYTLTTTSTSSPSLMVGGVTFFDDALLTITDGTLAGQHAVIAPAAVFQTAASMVVDTGGTLNLAGTFTVGKQLPGSLMIQNGGDVTSATGVLGESGAGDGIVTVTGAGSTWSNSGSVYVGGQAAMDGGNGTLSITNQGLVDIGGTLKLWPGGNVALDGGMLETGALELAGGAFNWTSGTLHLGSDLSVEPSGLLGGSVAVSTGKTLRPGVSLFVGNTGSGTLNITAGGDVLDEVGVIARANGSVGMATVNGAGSIWSNRNLFVGQNGEGTLDVVNGGLVRTEGVGLIGFAAGSSGAFTVDGAGSEWLNHSNNDMEVVVGEVGNGTLRIASGGRVAIYNSSMGAEKTVQVKIGEFTGSTGIVTIDGAGSTLIVQNFGNTFFIVGFNGNGTLNVTNGGKVQTSRTLSVGPLGGLGTLNINGGRQVINHGGSVGSTMMSGMATANVDGLNSMWTNDLSLRVYGALTVSNGGTVQATTLTVGATGKLSGDGNIVSNVVNNGEVHGDLALVGNMENNGLASFGMSPGVLNIDGDYRQTTTGELLIELASTLSYDQLLLTGEATLGGTLTVNLLDGFAPSVGQSFTILTADDIDGVFTTEMLPSVPGLIFDVIYNPQSVVLTVSPAFTADFD
ncbi:MAG: hypothetical protein H0T51_24185, partial [Pirellulales bacterium]|nr:hypothetical protein [Pirellulales bacterium]